MNTFLIFLVFFAPAAISACNYWSLAKCGYKVWRADSMPSGTMLEKIDSRVKQCDVLKDCGQVTVDCSKEGTFKKLEMQKAVDQNKFECALIHRMYKDDFVSCAIALEKHYWSKVCYNRTYNLSGTNIYDAFAGCVEEHIKKECTDDQYRIFKENRNMLMDYLPYVVKLAN
ncbi:unnamed protein product [Caenorhabditis angaria]|uniref:DUF19 domain-containing protein n=1 Tax=Caenorhabditis angaria TaxID=860376 RepID=A0A9P1N2I4_9PELO|nr:unnamed protein product [Caenorhabditis angaria]